MLFFARPQILALFAQMNAYVAVIFTKKTLGSLANYAKTWRKLGLWRTLYGVDGQKP